MRLLLSFLMLASGPGASAQDLCRAFEEAESLVFESTETDGLTIHRTKASAGDGLYRRTYRMSDSRRLPYTSAEALEPGKISCHLKSVVSMEQNVANALFVYEGVYPISFAPFESRYQSSVKGAHFKPNLRLRASTLGRQAPEKKSFRRCLKWKTYHDSEIDSAPPYRSVCLEYGDTEYYRETQALFLYPPGVEAEVSPDGYALILQCSRYGEAPIGKDELTAAYGDYFRLESPDTGTADE